MCLSIMGVPPLSFPICYNFLKHLFDSTEPTNQRSKMMKNIFGTNLSRKPGTSTSRLPNSTSSNSGLLSFFWSHESSSKGPQSKHIGTPDPTVYDFPLSGTRYRGDPTFSPDGTSSRYTNIVETFSNPRERYHNDPKHYARDIKWDPRNKIGEVSQVSNTLDPRSRKKVDQLEHLEEDFFTIHGDPVKPEDVFSRRLAIYKEVKNLTLDLMASKHLPSSFKQDVKRFEGIMAAYTVQDEISLHDKPVGGSHRPFMPSIAMLMPV